MQENPGVATAIKPPKSEQTLQSIVQTALRVAISDGLHSVTLGEVAKRMGISKSGVFARVGSVETLQHMVVSEYSRLFVSKVFLPALNAPRGLPRLDTIMRLWIDRGIGEDAMAGGLESAVAFDLDEDTSTLRDQVLESVNSWRAHLKRSIIFAVKEGHLMPDTDVAQLAYELNSLMIGFLYDARFLNDSMARERALSAYERMVATYRNPAYQQP